MAAEEKGEEPKQVKWRVIIALRLWLDVSRQINHLPTGPGFGEGQAALGRRVCLPLQDAPALFLLAPGLLGESPPALDLSASRLLSLALLLPCPLRVGDDDEPDDDMIELRLYRVRRSGCPGRPRLASLRRGVTIPATGPRGDGPRAHRGVYREEARPW